MKHLSSLSASLLIATLGANAQYCSPTFQNGCSAWKITNVTVGSFWNWDYSDCTAWDQTAMLITVTSSDSIPMSVTDGAWSGCSVWVDWDNSGTFEASENLYHQYIGGDPGYTYSFNIGIPTTTVEGGYRMRVIGAWGSDGFTDGSSNGSGPCGTFQYGNFNDFTLMVDNNTAVTDRDPMMDAFTASPNPTAGPVILSSRIPVQPDAVVTVESTDGRIVRTCNGNGSTSLEVDLSALPAGLYIVRNTSTASSPLRVVKE